MKRAAALLLSGPCLAGGSCITTRLGRIVCALVLAVGVVASGACGPISGDRFRLLHHLNLNDPFA